jgi:hypothetical protein
VDYEPPGFLKEAAEDEGWLSPQWEVWDRRRRPSLESKFGVTKLELLRDGKWLILGADGPYGGLVKVESKADLPTYAALLKLDAMLERHKKKGIRWKRVGD